MKLSKQKIELFLPHPVIWSHNFKMVFRNRKLDYLNRNWNYFSNLQSSDQSEKKQEMELSRQEMELFLPLPVIKNNDVSLLVQIDPDWLLLVPYSPY
jgi:hypothetical protein